MPKIISTSRSRNQIPEAQAAQWAAAIVNWQEALRRPQDFPEDTAALRAYWEAYWDILMRMSAIAAPRDSWERFSMACVPFIESKKLRTQFCFGTCDLTGRFRMSVRLANAQYLAFMPDDFWRTLLEVADYGTMSFEANVSFSKHKSIIWKMIDEFESLRRESEAHHRDAFCDFGSIIVTWPASLSLVDVYDRGMETFRRLYRLNYLLYRPAYQSEKAREKRTNT